MDKPLRIVFMGTPRFALGILQELVARHYRVVGVVSAPPKPSGRGLKLLHSEVAAYALEQKIPWAQPLLLKDPLFIDQLKAWNADLFVVVAFRMLPQEVWQLPRIGTFNLHASLLPQYRGAAPINWALIHGEQVTGVTTFLIDHQIDTGKILFQEPLAIMPDDTAGTLHDRLMSAGMQLVCRTIDAFSLGEVAPQPQPQIDPLFSAPKLNKAMCRISWTQTSTQICNLIRGLSPYPAAIGTMTGGKKAEGGRQKAEGGGQNAEQDAKRTERWLNVKVFEAIPIVAEHNLPAGAIVSDQKSYLYVACKDGYVSLTHLQAEGKKRMEVKDFLLGFRNITQVRFG